jgi:hypothetical protein
MLTTAQIAIVKADIAANTDTNNIPAGSDGSWTIANLYNELAVPDYFVWRTNVPADEVMRNGMDWTRVDNLSIGKARIWEWMTKLGSFNASKANIRAGIDACWVGTAADLAVRAAVYTHCNRPATRLEKLLAAGIGTVASPATMAYEGTVSYQNIDTVRTS